MTDENKQLIEQFSDRIAVEEQNVTKQIVEQQDLDKLKDLTVLFNATQMKKNALRVQKLNDLFDKVTDGMMERFEKRSDEFSNRDLLDYMAVTQAAIEKAQKGFKFVEDTVPINLTQQNNQQVNITVPEETLSRESKNRVLEIITTIMQQKPHANVQNTEKETDIEIGTPEISENKGDE